MKLFNIIFIFIFFGFLNASDIKFQNLSANFTQIVKNSNSQIKYSGNFIIDENRAFWKYEKPIEKFVYFDGKIFTQIEPNLEQAIVTKIQNAPNLTQIFAISKKISKDFYKAVYNETTYEIWTKNSLPIKIKYEDKLANLIEINLTKIQKNQNLKDEIFTPKIPSNYDVINN